MKFQSRYDDHTRGLKGIHLSRDESIAAYSCMRCGKWMGCASCIENITDIICSQCRDWANVISVQVRGKMVKDPEHRILGMRLLMMVEEGKLTYDQYRKNWDDAHNVFNPRSIFEAPK